MMSSKRRRNSSTVVALGGICSALSIVIMLLSSIIPLATYIAPMLAGIALLPMKEEMGMKSALTSYIACSVLSLLIVPEKECVMMFVFILGYYPIIKDSIDGKIKNKFLKIVSKLLIFNLSVFAGYFVLIKLFALNQILEEFGGMVLMVSTIVLGNVAFLIYDRALALIKVVYYYRIRKKFGLK